MGWDGPLPVQVHLGEGFTRYIVNYTIRGRSSVDVRISNRLTTTYQVSGVSGVSVGDDIAWIVHATYVSIDDNDNTSTLSVVVETGMGTMQACPAVSATDCRPPRNMTFNQYDSSRRALDFDFVAPLSGGLTRLHYQPQHRRLPATAWTNMSFTVAADSTTWGVIFDNESFTTGRTIEFRLVAICTGDVESVPSNVVSYTYPGSTPTPTPMGVRFPDLTALLLVCRVSGSNNETEVTATWAAPDGTLPADVTRIGYSVTWLDLGDPTSISVLVTSTSATLTGEYPVRAQGARPC